jgi:predicted small metal-binding protein
MAGIIDCECGTVIRGADEQELLQGAREHMQRNHPAIAGQITDEELLALSQEDSAEAGSGAG